MYNISQHSVVPHAIADQWQLAPRWFRKTTEGNIDDNINKFLKYKIIITKGLAAMGAAGHIIETGRNTEIIPQLKCAESYNPTGSQVTWRMSLNQKPEIAQRVGNKPSGIY